jgi:hypothetical protein
MPLIRHRSIHMKVETTPYDGHRKPVRTAATGLGYRNRRYSAGGVRPQRRARHIAKLRGRHQGFSRLSQDDRLPANLYVADASLLPKALGNPPILTIVAMALRVARVLRDRFAD